MKIVELLKNLANASITIVATISGVVAIVLSSRPYLGTAIIIIAIVSVVTGSLLRRRVSISLRDTSSVLLVLSKIVHWGEVLIFVGDLRRDVWDALREGVNRNVKLTIFNTDSEFYTRGTNSTTVEEIVNLDSNSRNFSHRYYFCKHNFSIVLASRGNHQQQLLYFVNPSGELNGIYIRRGIVFDKQVIDERLAPTISMAKQAAGVHGAMEQTKEFWIPLTKGWFEPIFPPVKDQDVRKAWRTAILKWFERTARSQATPRSVVTITWNLEDSSPEDATDFSNWLEFLKTNKNIQVERYMLLGASDYSKPSGSYKQMVDKILLDYLPQPIPRPQSDRYKVWFIDKDGLPKYLRSNFALFKQGDKRIAQFSIPDKEAVPEVLKIYFSQDYGVVERIQSYLDALKSNYDPKPSLAELVT